MPLHTKVVHTRQYVVVDTLTMIQSQPEQPDMVMLPNRGMSKVPTIASDKELAKLESIRKATSNRQQQQSSSSAAVSVAASSSSSSSSGSKIDASGKGRLDPKKARWVRSVKVSAVSSRFRDAVAVYKISISISFSEPCEENCTWTCTGRLQASSGAFDQ